MSNKWDKNEAPLSSGTLDSGELERRLAVYSEGLLKYASKNLSSRLASRLDPEDVVQSALRTFIGHLKEKKILIDNSTKLWRILTRITVMKARAKARKHTAKKRDINRELDHNDEWIMNALSRSPDPGAELIFTERIESILAGLPSVYAEILRMRLANMSVAEIANETGLSRQAVYRAIQLIQHRAKK